MSWKMSIDRGQLRLGSGLVMFTFVACHLIAHVTLLISIDFAQPWLAALMFPWRTDLGEAVLVAAFIVHYGNALWSIYTRRTFRISHWEWSQIILGFSIPFLLALHVTGTSIAENLLGVHPLYSMVLISQWVHSFWINWLQMTALVVVWAHACIGLHFWLRTKPSYEAWRPYLGAVALLLPTLALAGYVSAGNQLVRLAATDPDTVQTLFERSRSTAAKTFTVERIVLAMLAVHAGLTFFAIAARAFRNRLGRRQHDPVLSLAGGRKCAIRNGATVLETLREYGIPHAAVCGGRGRCTTCRVLVTQGIGDLPEPEELEARALERISAAPGIRLACQICPTSNTTILPLLAANANAADGSAKGGLEGRERPITVMFVDLRESTALGESRMPYDVLFLLNQFFHEMKEALIATRGHYSQFTGDGLMALYGLQDKDAATGPADALRGAKEMLIRLDQLNQRLGDEIAQPLRMGIGIHFSEAIVGTMGPPGSQIITAIGDPVNTCARLEGLTKEYDCPVIVSRRAAETAGIDAAGLTLHDVQVRGRISSVEFYAIDSETLFASV